VTGAAAVPLAHAEGMVERPAFTFDRHKSHDDFMQALEAWGQPFGLTSFSKSDSACNSAEVNTTDFPFSYAVFRCKKCKGKGRCGFRIRYKLDFQMNDIKVTIFELPVDSIHLSSLAARDSSSGVTTIVSQSELTTEERDYLLSVGPDRVPAPQVRKTMARLFGGPARQYSRALLNRVMRLGREAFTGSDKDSVVKFLEHGHRIRQLGGKFVYDICPASMKLVSYHTQTVLERELADWYGRRLFYMDSTHNMTRYYLRALPPSGMDCLGHICSFGIALIEGETIATTRESLQRFGLDNPGASAGTDGAPGWVVPLEEAGINQFLDTFHSQRNVDDSKGGLGNKANEYVRALKSALTFDFGTDERLVSHLQSTIDNLAGDSKSASHTMATKILENRKKMCFTHVGNLFICSEKGAASPGESVMSRYKGTGTLKGSMKNWNLFEFAQHHEELLAAYASRVLEEIKSLIRAGRYCSDYVLKRVKVAIEDSSKYKIVAVFPGHHCADRDLLGTLYHVQNKTGENKPVHCVFIPDDVSLHPSCSCRKFSCFLLPDAHCARVYAEVDDGREFGSKVTLDPYWWLEKHPLYKYAHADLTEAAALPPLMGLPSLAESDAGSGEWLPTVVICHVLPVLNIASSCPCCLPDDLTNFNFSTCIFFRTRLWRSPSFCA